MSVKGARDARIVCYVDTEMNSWLNFQAEKHGVSLSTCVTTLLRDTRRRMDEPETAMAEQLAIHLDRIHTAIREVKDDTRFLEEFLASYLRVYMNHAPIIPENKVREVEKMGRERFDKFLRYLMKNYSRRSLLSDVRNATAGKVEEASP